MFVIILLTISPLQTHALELSDIEEDAWYYNAVKSSIEHGYINGYEDGTFKPHSNVTYGEFYKMTAVATGLNIPTENNEGHWALPYAHAIFSAGDNNAITYAQKLNNTITRKEAIRTLMIAIGINEVVDSKFYETQPFYDMPKHNVWAYDGHIMNAYHIGIVMGYNNKVNPDSYITRAEAVAIIERALALENKNLPQPNILKDIKITYIGKYAKTFKNDLCVALSKFPQTVIDEFLKDNGEIIVTDEHSSKYYNGPVKSEISGLYYPNRNQIVLFTNGNSASLTFGVSSTLAHEIGHYMHFEMLSNEDKQEITRIFNEGKEPDILAKLLYHSYCKESVNEFWAELVTYITSSNINSCESNIPQSFAIAKKYFISK